MYVILLIIFNDGVYNTNSLCIQTPIIICVFKEWKFSFLKEAPGAQCVLIVMLFRLVMIWMVQLRLGYFFMPDITARDLIIYLKVFGSPLSLCFI